MPSVDIENRHHLIEYLLNHNFLTRDQKVRMEILKGGVSNKTVLLQFTDQSDWVLKQALEKLRVPGDWYSKPERVHREAEAMKWFEKYAPPNTVPKLIFEDQQHHLLGMEAIDPPFQNLKDLLLAEEPHKDYFVQAGTLLGSIHRSALENQQELPELFQDDHFFHTLRIEPYYVECVKAVPKSATFFKELIKETKEGKFTLVHGDFSPKNLLVKDDKLILLDHEVIHFGDGTFDLGFFITHLLSKAHHIPNHRDSFLIAALDFYRSYATKVQLTLTQQKRVVRHTIGCCLARVCGLSQLEYLTADEREKQKIICLSLIQDEPDSVENLLTAFKELINE
ncbi:MAG: aminoglycoside phosphotransferase family protein [Cyclobacteriaceae bacterium]